MATTTSSGTFPWARWDAASANKSIAVTSSKQTLRCSYRMPLKPALRPRREDCNACANTVASTKRGSPFFHANHQKHAHKGMEHVARETVRYRTSAMQRRLPESVCGDAKRTPWALPCHPGVAIPGRGGAQLRSWPRAEGALQPLPVGSASCRHLAEPR